MGDPINEDDMKGVFDCEDGGWGFKNGTPVVTGEDVIGAAAFGAVGPLSSIRVCIGANVVKS